MKTEKQHGILSKYEQRLVLEGKLKALLLALTIGFGGALILGAVSWYTGTNSLLLCLLIAALRVLGGQHYPGDVLAALALSSVVSLIGYVLI